MIIFLLKAVEGFLLASRVALRRLSVACFKVECIRSCRPLSCGEAGRERSGTMPSFTHSIDTRLSPPGARLANGTPLSV